jgi:hypothetical protein
MITHDFAVSRETFAADRKKVLTDAAGQLEPHVKDALNRVGLPGWEAPVVAAALDLFDVTARAEVDEWSGVLDDMRDAFAKELGDALAKTKKAPPEQLLNQLGVITGWVAQMSHNAAIEAATTADPSGDVGLEWVTMHDAGVRTAHKDVDGQTVPTGHEFEVAGEKLLYPGQPVGDPSVWINCRCLARPTMLTESAGTTESFAAATADAEQEEDGDGFTSAVIVALPAASDPISAASSESSGAHATLLFLGDTTALDEAALNAAVKQFVTDGNVGVITEQVNGSATLGKDSADVVLFDAVNLVNIRGGLLGMDEIAQAYEQVEQFPTWLPHVTLGYPETPRVQDYAGESITFDRLAVWFGESRTEYPLGQAAPAPAPVDEATAALSYLRTLTAAAGLAPAPVEAEAPSDEDLEWESLQGAEIFAEVPWYGVLAPESIFSGDKRKFDDGALTQRPLPLPLKFMWEDDDGHKGSFPVGRIDRIWRENGLIKAEGVFDTSPQAYETIRLLANSIMRGVSVDLDAASAAVGEDNGIEFAAGRICSATICAIPAFAEAFVSIGTWADAAPAPTPQDGQKGDAVPAEAVAAGQTEEFDIPPVKTMDGPGWITDPAPTHKITAYWVDGRGAAKIGWGVPGDFNRCRVQLAKYVQNPEWLAGLCANLHYRALGAWPGQAALEPDTVMNQPLATAPSVSLVASAAPAISADFFRNPMLEEPTPVTRGEDGLIFGHLGEWGTCHIGYKDVCVTPPESHTDYAYFLTGQVFTDAGPVAVGQLTVGGGHAPDGVSVRAAIAHYDNVAAAVADVTVGEDAHGIWFSGRLRPWATEQQIHELFAAGPSGDWREVRARGTSSMELVAAHAVNVPGFGVPRARFAVEDGRQVSLVAAGALKPREDAASVFADIRGMLAVDVFNEISTMKGK